MVASLNALSLSKQLLDQLSLMETASFDERELEALNHTKTKLQGLFRSGLTGLVLVADEPSLRVDDSTTANLSATSASTTSASTTSASTEEQSPLLFVSGREDAQSDAMSSALLDMKEVIASLKMLAQAGAETQAQSVALAQVFSKMQPQLLSDELSLVPWSKGWWLVVQSEHQITPHQITRKTSDQGEKFQSKPQSKFQSTMLDLGVADACAVVLKTPEVRDQFKAFIQEGLAAMFLADLSGSVDDLTSASIAWQAKMNDSSLKFRFNFNTDAEATVFSRLMKGKVDMLRTLIGGANSLQALGATMSTEENEMVAHMSQLIGHLNFRTQASNTELTLNQDFFVTLGELAMIEREASGMGMIPLLP